MLVGGRERAAHGFNPLAEAGGADNKAVGAETVRGPEQARPLLPAMPEERINYRRAGMYHAARPVAATSEAAHAKLMSGRVNN